MNGRAKLRRFLKQHGLTQEAFAEKAHVPGPQVSLWLSGKRRPGPDSIAKLRDATGGEITFDDWVRRGGRGTSGDLA
jgi:transcriptional regulator with XRE-family HTH domain